ncbi:MULTISPECIES: hypothetical protein [unclassified Methylobacterium]|uniref:hypothetical protein n=1 Tax=unclassified Methylobacterium TaxID=2615210 RepID=UPI002269A977|nr:MULTISPECIES: hypothetical protein [unclassified Methylobacterium]
MRSTLTFAVIVASLAAGSASADERLHIIPPLYRDHARSTQAVRHSSDLITTPQPVRAPTPLDVEPMKAGTEIVASAR